MIINIINILFTIISAIIVWKKCTSAFTNGIENYNQTKSQQILTAIPGVCTAWGIFFTFFSIVLCLVLLVIVGDSSDFSIFKITGSIIPAFITSVIGMWYSIKYSEETKKIIANDEAEEIKKYGNPSEILSKLYSTSVNSNSLLQNDLRGLLSQLCSTQDLSRREITDSLKQTEQNISNAILANCSGVSENITEQTKAVDLISSQLVVIKQKIESQNDSIQSFVNSFTAEFEKFFKSAHNSFEQQMKDFTTTEIVKYTETLTSVGKQLKEVSENILTTQKESVESIGQQVVKTLEDSNTDVSNKLNKYSSDTEEKITESTSTITESLNAVVESIKELTTQCKELITALQTKQEEATKTAIETQKTVLETSTKEMKDSLDANTKEFAGSLTTSVETMVSTINTMTTELKNKLDNIQTSQTEATNKAVELHKVTLETSAKNISENLLKYTQTVSKNIEDATNNATASMQANSSEAAEAIRAITEEVKTNFKDLSTKITETALTPLETLKKEIEFVTDRVGQICQSYIQAQEGYTNSLQNVHDSNENWEKVVAANSKSLTNIEATSVHVQEILDVLKERQEAVEGLRKEIGSIAETIAQLQELNSVLTKILAR